MDVPAQRRRAALARWRVGAATASIGPSSSGFEGSGSAVMDGRIARARAGFVAGASVGLQAVICQCRMQKRNRVRVTGSQRLTASVRIPQFMLVACEEDN